MVLFSLVLFFPELVFAFCETVDKSGLDKDLCQVINTVENDTGCDPFKGPSHELFIYDACISLKKLKDTGSCRNLRDTETVGTYIICNEIFLGLDSGSCEGKMTEFNFSPEEKEGIDSIVSFEVRQSMCEFGRYIKRNFSLISKARDQAVMEFAVESGLTDHLASTPSCSNSEKTPLSVTLPFSARLRRLSDALHQMGANLKNPIPPNTREKEVRLGTVVLKLIGSNQAGPRTCELAEYVRSLISIVEENRMEWLEQHRTESLNSKRTKQTPLTIEIGQKFGTQEVPSKLEITDDGTPDGKVVVFLDRIKINNKIRTFSGLGRGTSKTVDRSFDYDISVSAYTKKTSLDSGFLASGFIKTDGTNKERNKLPIAEQIAQNMVDVSREFKIQSLFLGKNGVATAGSVAHSIDHGDPSKNKVVTTQKFYPYTLKSFIEYLNSKEIDAIEGRSKATVRIDLGVDLLEGLAAIHDEGIHHRDIKPGNIYVGNDEKGLAHAYIADFGVAFDTKGRPELLGAPLKAGTIPYLSPEMAKGLGTSAANENLKNDVWALGLCFYFIYSGNSHVEKGLNELQYLYKIGKRINNYSDLSVLGIKFSSFPDAPAPDTYEGVIYAMLNPDVNHRPSAKEALRALEQVRDANNKRASAHVGFQLSLRIPEKTTTVKHVSWDNLSPEKTPREYRGIEKMQQASEIRFKKDADFYTEGKLNPAKIEKPNENTDKSMGTESSSISSEYSSSFESSRSSGSSRSSKSPRSSKSLRSSKSPRSSVSSGSSGQDEPGEAPPLEDEANPQH